MKLSLQVASHSRLSRTVSPSKVLDTKSFFLDFQWLLLVKWSSPDLMTVHNLKEHLKWLVTSNPVKPPPLGLTASSAEAGNTGTVVDGIPYAPNLQVENIVPDVRANEVDHHNFRESQPEIPSPLSHSTSYAETGIMARLQSAPRSGTKSRLLSQMMTAPLRTPRASQSQTPSASLQNRFDQGTSGIFPYTKALSNCSADHSGRPRTVKAVEQKKYQLQTPATSTARERLISTGTSVDLSGEVELQNSSSAEEVFGESRQIWREDSAARKEPLSKIGKKRKSEELEVGVVDGIHTPHLSQSSFIAVDAYPDEAPPPYSRIFPESFPPNSRTTDQSSSQRIRPETHKTNLNQSSPPSKRTKHVPKNPQTPRREAMPLLRELRQAGLNVPVESRYAKSVFCGEAVKPENTIADSEDEGSEVELEESAEAPNMDDVITVKEDIGETIYPVLPKIAATTGMNPSRVRFETGRALDTATTKAELNPSASCFTRTSSDPSPFQHDSPTKLASEQVRQQHKSSDSLGNIARGLTNKERDSVNCFMNLPPYCVENYRGSLHLARTSNAEKLYICLVEGGIGSPEMQQESASLKVKIDALDILIRLKNDYVKVNRHKEELKRRIITAIQDDQDLSTYAQDLAKSKAIAEDLLKIELQISNSLAKAALPLTDAQPLSYSHASKIPDSTDNSDKRSTLLVQATQNPQQYQNLRAPEKRVSLAHAPATTQYVQQTQVLDTSPRTPKKLAQTNFSQIQRSPLRTYTSSPRTKDVNAYFSPSKRKPRFEEPVTDAKTRQRLDIDMVKPSIGSQPKHSHQIVEEYDLEEETFSANMASPLQAFVDEDDYGHDVDDEEMLEVTEEFESRSLLPSAGYGAERRQVFAETTGNVIRLEKPKSRSSQTNAAAQASHMQHVWSRDVKAAMKERFHLRGFRPNQLEAINATLSGKDTFVLMPTGGGKSLCYQLPSIIKSGKTRGVTVVISPLLSLMQDQVAHLQNLKIQALLINSEVTTEHRRLVMESLRDPQVEKYIQLLYITPEMLSKSQAIISAFRDLYQRQKLARIVIDEAHCVSQWGHDFRPDYKLLGQVRGQFKGVPVMALTATATENVKVDVIHNLGIENCEVLTQSFNRPNLTYDVRSKGKGKEVLDDIVTTIKTLYKNQSGIIYCLSRKNCESIAEKLRNEHHIMAYHYHAGMDPGEKTSVQKQWQAGIYHVIVATIAFGMGIDKPDVRFVIHHTIPKSLEGYYQETGRAGRDGKRSGCYLYYGYQDINALKRMIDDGEGSWEQKERQRQMLRNMFSFCENRSDCRRVQVLNYFNESYNREDCNGACDNCNSKCSFESQDFSKFAIAAITLVKKIEQDSVTLLHCVDVFRGGKTKKITSLKHSILEEYGAGSQLERGDVERLFYRLLSEDALAEENKVNKGGFATNYLHVGIGDRIIP